MTGQVALLAVVRWKAGKGVSGFARLAFSRWLSLRNVAGMTFFKSLGSGRNGGFQVVPGLAYQGLFAVFEDDASADAFVATSPLLAAYRNNGDEKFLTKLRAYSSRGRWSGVTPFEITAQEPASGPIASLTRASIRPAKALRFWRHAAPSQTDLDKAEGCLLAVGLGEAPVFRQATFTIWQDQAALDRYARTGAHLAAIRAARAERYFSEDLFTKFVPYAMSGTWKGRSYTEESTSIPANR